MYYVTATVIDRIANEDHWPPLVEVHLPESGGGSAVILEKAAVLGADLRDAALPRRLDLQCDVVDRQEQTVLVKLRHGVEDRRGRNVFRVDAGAVRTENPGEILDRVVLTHHLTPRNVADVESAWLAFTEFAQIGIDGLELDDGDGVIVQWGRCHGNGGAASLTFTRQLALATDDEPQLWQVGLEIHLSGFDILPAGRTDWDFTPVGPGRAAALAALRAGVDDDPLLSVLWHARPVGSTITYECVDRPGDGHRGAQ